MLKAVDKTKEGLLKKLRAYTTIVAGVFFVVIVVLVWQFASIAHQKKLTKELAGGITELREQTNGEIQNKQVYQSEEYRDFVAASEYDRVRK
jgi:sensor domain CHASE-containing protein